MVLDPLPLAYAAYAFINVDNCERPLTPIDLASPESPTSQWGYFPIAGRETQSLMLRARFVHLKYNMAGPGIEPRSPACHAGVLTTTLPRHYKIEKWDPRKQL